MGRPKAAVSWSGGKDSCLALHRAQQEYEVTGLITMFAEDGERTRAHGLPREIIQRQADSMSLGLATGASRWGEYEGELKRILEGLKERGVTHIIFGDILLQEHKDWVERVCGEMGLTAVEPLWNESTTVLLEEFLALGGQAQIVACRVESLDAGWLGRLLAREMLPEFERLGVDPCGEMGEYHTVVLDAPAFRSPLKVQESGRLQTDNYWTAQLSLAG